MNTCMPGGSPGAVVHRARVGAGAASAPAGGNSVMGLNYAALPPGSMAIPKNGMT
ncbi:MAG TPA: hypothetical protein VJ501_08545 [Burkholderiaceae bacterium]|nr:hypothetical protein [Burkholderiaceae bacterium]